MNVVLEGPIERIVSLKKENIKADLEFNDDEFVGSKERNDDLFFSYIAITERNITRRIFALCCSGEAIDGQGGAVHQGFQAQGGPRTLSTKQAELAKISPTFKIDEAHFWLNGYVNKQNCRIWSEANPQVYVETPLHLEKLTVWCALWASGILLQKR
ncbi:hypothetical protein TNCV_4026221 [Trichonephila clavipes]|nr:hypothetical protein TNCV_4026221 [Trichonephila clavipes]